MDNLKKDFPIFKNNPGLIYLDNAATSQRPKVVIDALKNFMEKDNANVKRGIYTLSEKATREYEKAHRVVEKFINANPNEVIFTKNTTESINLLSYSLKSILPKGKSEIVLTEMEHHSNLIPWQEMAKREKMKLKFIKLLDDFTLDYEDAKRKITSKTAIVSVVHISNFLGTVNNIKYLCDLAKTKRAISIVDAAQSVSHMKIDVKEIGCDFMAFSGHKMFGPTGIGFLYGKKELLNKLSPFQFGGGMIKDVNYTNASWADLPYKFEAGTQNIGEAIATIEAVKYLNKFGFSHIEKRDKELLYYILKELSKLKDIKIYNSGIKNSSGIVSFNLKGTHPHDIASILNDYNIAVRAGHHCVIPLMKKLKINGAVRISFSVFNNEREIDKLVHVLKIIIKKFKNK